MQVAKRLAGEPFDPDATIDSILNVVIHRRKARAKKAKLTAEDISKAEKLHTYVVRGDAEWIWGQISERVIDMGDCSAPPM